MPRLFFISYGAYSALVLASLYAAGLFGYHDLGLINDFLANTARGRGFFWVTEQGISHLQIHFTPSLLLLIPFYWLFETPTLLLIFNWASVLGGLLGFYQLSTWFLSRRLKRSELAWPILWIVLLLLCLNRYTKSILTCAHYETFYFLCWPWIALSLIKGKTLWQTALLTLLGLGCRSDLGFYFFFQTLGLLFFQNEVPAKSRPRFAQNVVAISVMGLVHFLTNFTVVGPLLGAQDSFTRFLGAYGDTPLAIAWGILSSPIAVLTSLSKSAFVGLLPRFFFLPLLEPRILCLTLVPAIPMFLTPDGLRTQLGAYHSTLIFPGVWLATLSGLAYGLKRFPPNLKFFGWGVITISTLATFPETGNGFHFRPYGWGARDQVKAIQETLASCPKARAVAVEFHASTFVPNQVQMRLFKEAEHADLAFVPETGDPLLSGKASWAEVVQAMANNPGWKLRNTFPWGKVYERVGFGCAN